MSEATEVSTELANSISIDIGGTFTDCFVSYKDQQASGKAPTTRHRLADGFNNAIADCALKLGVEPDELVANTDIVRYATTLAMNALIERNGPKLGLLTTAGFEDTTIIGKGALWHDGLPVEVKRLTARGLRPEPVIPRNMIVGIHERVDDNGEVLASLNDDEVRRAIRTLIDRGAMGFVVAFLQSHRNSAHERRVRELILEQFPEVYLGSQAVMLSSEVLAKHGEYQRNMTATLAAFLHRTMADELTELGVSLHDRGYRRPLYIVNAAGGANPLQRTSAVETYNAGPVAGVIGGAHVAQMYGIENIILSDMGGTSFDIGTVVGVGSAADEGGTRHFYSEVPMIDRFRVGINMIETKSIGAGGGSIATYNELLNVVEVGPQSAGSNPGPACFGLGGELPTVTDADVVLGYVDPSYFLGGKYELDADAARDSVREHLAEPLDVSVEEAAFLVKTLVDAKMGHEVFKETNLKGYDPREFSLFAFGGAGGAHACGYGNYVETPTIMTFPLASVFSAYGIANTDFLQTYEHSQAVRLYDRASGWVEDFEAYNSVVRSLQERALRDADDLGAKAVNWSLELQMRYATQPHTTRARSPRIFLNSAEDVREVYRAFELEYGRRYSSAATHLPGGVEIVSFTLQSSVSTPKVDMPILKIVGEDPSPAEVTSRPTFWGAELGWVNTPVYRREGLQPGNLVVGPAVIEATDTTVVIEPGRLLKVDERGSGVIEKKG